MDVRIATVTLTFADPLLTAYGTLSTRELLLLRLCDGDGSVGWGEAAPLKAYDGVSAAKVRDAFEAYEAILRDGDGAHAADLLERCRIVADVPLAPAGLELVEEPVHGVKAMRQVRDRVPVRVAMDETAGQPGSLTAKVADAVCLKVSRCGGISRLLAQAALARASGADVYLASTFDGPLGIAAAVHCAAALNTTAACGLGTLGLFADELTVLPVEDGAIAVPEQPGLGV